MGTETEVTDSLAGVAGATEDNGVATGGGSAGELVEGDDLTASLQDAGLSTLGEAEGSNGDLLGGLHETVVVSDGTNDDDGLASSTRAGDSTRDAGDRHRGTVSLGEEELSQDDLVELGIRTASKEAVKLHKQAQVWVLRSRLLALATASVGLAEVINSHCTCAED